MSPAIRDRVKQEIANRRKMTIAQLARPVWEDANQVQFSPKFAELGLIQGQKLMLIDLDRCTRCDECVKACVNTHSDGRTRLFLDGPRFGKYLVPTTCRSCLDPVCMIGCPVGAIHRGDNRQIVIEDWCIGCAACAETMPLRLDPDARPGADPGGGAHGWRWLPASVKGASGEWQKPGFKTCLGRRDDAVRLEPHGSGSGADLLGGQATHKGPDLSGIAVPLRGRAERQETEPESRFKIELMSFKLGRPRLDQRHRANPGRSRQTWPAR